MAHRGVEEVSAVEVADSVMAHHTSVSESDSEMKSKGEDVGETNDSVALEGTTGDSTAVRETLPAKREMVVGKEVVLQQGGSVGKGKQVTTPAKLQNAVKASSATAKRTSSATKPSASLSQVLKKPTAVSAKQPSSAGTVKPVGQAASGKGFLCGNASSTSSSSSVKCPTRPLQSKAEPSAASKVSTGARNATVAVAATSSAAKTLSRPSTAPTKASPVKTVSSQPPPSSSGKTAFGSKCASALKLSPQCSHSEPAVVPSARSFSHGTQTASSGFLNQTTVTPPVKKIASSVPARSPTAATSGCTPKSTSAEPTGKSPELSRHPPEPNRTCAPSPRPAPTSLNRTPSSRPAPTSLNRTPSPRPAPTSLNRTPSPRPAPNSLNHTPSPRPAPTKLNQAPSPRPARGVFHAPTTISPFPAAATRTARPFSASSTAQTTKPSPLANKTASPAERQRSTVATSRVSKEPDAHRQQAVAPETRKSQPAGKVSGVHKASPTTKSMTTLPNKLPSTSGSGQSAVENFQGRELEAAESKDLQSLRLYCQRMAVLVPALAITAQHFHAAATSRRQKQTNAQVFVKGLRHQIEKMRAELITAQRDRQQAQNMLTEAEEQHKATCADMASEHQKTIAELRAVLVEEHQKAVRDHEKALKVSQTNQAENMSCLRYAHSQRLAEVQDELDTLRLKYCNVMGQLEGLKAAEAERREAMRCTGSANEADSLRYVIDLKNEELKKLRQRCNELELKVKESVETERKVSNLTSRKEELEAQVETYREQQQKLREEVASLTKHLEDGQRSNRRLSQTADELRWKLESSDFDSALPNGYSPKLKPSEDIDESEA